jgi:peptidoglycan/LPS O-acetylase OafA/YrhL
MESYLVQWTAGIGSAFTILGAAGLELKGQLRIHEFLQFLGNASYSIYLVHYPFLMFFTPLVYKASLHAAVPLPVLLLTMIACATCVGCLTHVLIERPLLQRMGKLRPA